MRHGIYISKEKIVRTYKCGVLHCETHPAMYYNGHSVSFEDWYINGKFHRLNGPAHTTRDGNYLREYWYHEGKQHREDGPAIVWTRISTQEITLIAWMLDGCMIPQIFNMEDFRIYKLKAFS
jgi:hypothetical protein